MHVVGHQDIGVDRTAVLMSSLLEAVQVEGVIRRLKEAGAAVVATLQHMLRDTGKVEGGRRAIGQVVSRLGEYGL